MKVGIWIRVSTEDQAKGESPSSHLARAKMQADIKGWEVVETYDLAGVSGKDILEHPEAQRMLSDIKSGHIKGLIFSKLARLARNTRQLLEISECFEKSDASLVSLDENIDTSTPVGRLLYTLIGALAQWEREEISARIAASIPIRARLGRHTGGQGSYGYHWVDGKIIPNPAEEFIVKRIFELFLETGKVLSTCEQLTKEGFRARKSEFSPRTLKFILRDTIYKGIRKSNYSSQSSGKLEYKSEEDWVTCEVKSIISDDIWERANEVLEATRQRYTVDRAISKRGKYLFSGLLLCKCCETKMYCAPYPGMAIARYVCRICKTKVNEDVVENALQSMLTRISLSPESLCGDDNYGDDLKDKQSRLELLKKDLKVINKKMDTLVDLAGEDRIDNETFSSRFEPLLARRNNISQEVPRLQGEIDFINSEDVGRQIVIRRATTLAALWSELSYEARQEIAKEVIERVDVSKESLHFTIHHISNPNKNDGETLADFPI